MTDKETLIPDLAIRTLREWVASPDFKVRAQSIEVQKATEIGQQLLSSRGVEYAELLAIWRQIRNYWKSKGWVVVEETAFGPKSFGTDDPRLEQLASAMERRGHRRDGRPYSEATERWIGAMTGAPTNKRRFQWVTLNYTPLAVFCAQEVGPQIDGQTREEVSDQFSLPLKLSKLVVDLLIEMGTHKQFRPRLADGSRPKQIVKVTPEKNSNQ